jgi:hypothetical protein
VYQSRIFELCHPYATIEDIDTVYWQLRVEPVPEDDQAVLAACKAQGVEAVPAFFAHSQCTPAGLLEDYGDPLVVMVRPDESLESAANRCEGPSIRCFVIH